MKDPLGDQKLKEILDDKLHPLKKLFENKDFQERMKKSQRSIFNDDIKFPLEVTKIICKQERVQGTTKNCLGSVSLGDPVSIRPCADKYEKKTFLGFYLGDRPLDLIFAYDPEDKDLTVFCHENPAFFVPKLRKIVWGCESFWTKISSVDQLREITDKDIDDTWYVKAMKEMLCAEDDS